MKRNVLIMPLTRFTDEGLCKGLVALNGRHGGDV